jgi:hypothetical protein
LVPFSAGAALLSRGIALRFGGAGSITLPTITPRAVAWVGEGKPFPVQQFSTAPGANLEPHKLGTISSLTAEMMNGRNSEAIVRPTIDSLAPALDASLFSNAGETRPQFCRIVLKSLRF